MAGYIPHVEFILGGVVFLLVVSRFIKLISANKGPEHWEYLIDGMDLGGDVPQHCQHFNVLGTEGWEATSTWLESPEASKTEKGLAFILFKRPLR